MNWSKLGFFAIAVLLFSTAQAAEIITPYKFTLIPKASGIIDTGTVSKTGLAANQNRKGFCIGNPFSETEPLYYDVGRAAAIVNPKSFEIPPGNMQCLGGLGTWTGTVTVNATTTGHGYILYEFN